MNDSINRQAAIDAVRTYYDEQYAHADSIEDLIEKLPSIDVMEARHGHWTLWEGDITYWLKCSECGKDVLPYYPHFDFCPHCGARMDGEQDG